MSHLPLSMFVRILASLYPLTKVVTSPPNLTRRWFPLYLLLTLLLHFLFIFYLSDASYRIFFLFFPGFLAIFILLSSNNNNFEFRDTLKKICDRFFLSYISRMKMHRCLLIHTIFSYLFIIVCRKYILTIIMY